MVYGAALTCGQFLGGVGAPIGLGILAGRIACKIDSRKEISYNKMEFYSSASALTISVALHLFGQAYLPTPVKLGLNSSALFFSAFVPHLTTPPRQAAILAILVGFGVGAGNTIGGGAERTAMKISALMNNPALNPAMVFLSGLFFASLTSKAVVRVFDFIQG